MNEFKTLLVNNINYYLQDQYGHYQFKVKVSEQPKFGASILKIKHPTGVGLSVPFFTREMEDTGWLHKAFKIATEAIDKHIAEYYP